MLSGYISFIAQAPILRTGRSTIHDGRNTRCPITRLKTGYEPGSDQDHITVYLGLLRNWVSVHGHLYTTRHPRFKAPTGLLPVADRWPNKNGKPGRNPELWKWTKRKAQEQSESYTKAMTSDNWRDDKGKTSKSSFFSNSRLPKK